ncbi:hypothetical protein OHB14_57840 [Streptomyces sp. NBC_01613]
MSKSAMSRALLDQGGANEDTRRRVAEVTQRLGHANNAWRRAWWPSPRTPSAYWPAR